MTYYLHFFLFSVAVGLGLGNKTTWLGLRKGHSLD